MRVFQNSNYGGQQMINTGSAYHSGLGDQHIYGGVGTLNHIQGEHARMSMKDATNRYILRQGLTPSKVIANPPSFYKIVLKLMVW